MAKFFKNYDRINLQIFNDVTEKLSDDELREINIQPKYLGMCSIKFCDFCPNDEDLNTSSDEISLLLGYQISGEEAFRTVFLNNIISYLVGITYFE